MRLSPPDPIFLPGILFLCPGFPQGSAGPQILVLYPLGGLNQLPAPPSLTLVQSSFLLLELSYTLLNVVALLSAVILAVIAD